jgi:predicted glycosyltransferase
MFVYVMPKPSYPRDKRILVDLNHPADFHLLKGLIRQLGQEGYQLRIVARDKDCLFALLRAAGMDFRSRGRGALSRSGKYLHGLYVLGFLAWQVIRFRPGLGMSLSSPYLNLVARIFHFRAICYDDTDMNPRLRPFIRMARVVISPQSYPLQFHKGHHRIPTFKEMAYLRPADFPRPDERDGIFLRLTRSDTIHHGPEAALDQEVLLRGIQTLSRQHRIILSSEVPLPKDVPASLQNASVLDIHRELNLCRVFFGNSATMAAEAVILGIPAIFIGTEKFAYLGEMEQACVLWCFPPSPLEDAFRKLEEILSGSEPDPVHVERHRMLLEGRVDPLEFIHNLLAKPSG